MKQTISRVTGRKRNGRKTQQPQDRADCTWPCYAAFVNCLTEALTAVVFLPMYIHFLLENYGLGKIAEDS